MTDVLLGATLPQFTDDRARLLDSARAAEDSGLDSIWLFDHLWPLSGGKERPVLECWSTLAWLATATEKITLGTLVTRSSLRHPPLLAKMIATVAAVAPGRIIVAIGSGDEASRAENEAFGLPYYVAPERIEQLRATVGFVDSYLNGEPVTDAWVGSDALPPSPIVSPPTSRPTIWVGGRTDDVLALAATKANGWNGWGGDPKRFARDAQQVLAYANGRPIELSWGGIVDPALDTETVGGLAGFVDVGARHLVVTPRGSGGQPDFYARLGRVAGSLG